MTALKEQPTRSFRYPQGYCWAWDREVSLTASFYTSFRSGIICFSSWYPITTIKNLKLNTVWDGVFHSVTYSLVLVGLFILSRSGPLSHFQWSTGDLRRCSSASERLTLPRALSITSVLACTSTKRLPIGSGPSGTLASSLEVE